jgi:hypothetical protein
VWVGALNFFTKATLNIMALAIFGLPKKCNFWHFYIHTSVAVATCATRQKGKKKTLLGRVWWSFKYPPTLVTSSYPQKWSFILKGGFIRGWHVSRVLGRFSAVWFLATGLAGYGRFCPYQCWPLRFLDGFQSGSHQLNLPHAEFLEIVWIVHGYAMGG